VPCPGKKTGDSAKKAVVPLFPDAGFRHLRQVNPFRSGSLCGEEEGMKWEGLIPAPIVFAACPFARATSRQVETTN